MGAVALLHRFGLGAGDGPRQIQARQPRRFCDRRPGRTKVAPWEPDGRPDLSEVEGWHKGVLPETEVRHSPLDRRVGEAGLRLPPTSPSGDEEVGAVVKDGSGTPPTLPLGGSRGRSGCAWPRGVVCGSPRHRPGLCATRNSCPFPHPERGRKHRFRMGVQNKFSTVRTSLGAPLSGPRRAQTEHRRPTHPSGVRGTAYGRRERLPTWVLPAGQDPLALAAVASS